MDVATGNERRPMVVRRYYDGQAAEM